MLVKRLELSAKQGSPELRSTARNNKALMKDLRLNGEK